MIFRGQGAGTRITRRFHLRSYIPTTLFVMLAVSNAAAQSYMFSRANYPVVNSSEAVAVGDFNHDGRPDVVAAGEVVSSISVLIANPDGTFQTQVEYPIGSLAKGIAVGDFNNDGKLDIAVAGFINPGVSVLLGNGDGTFLPYVFLAATGRHGKSRRRTSTKMATWISP